MNDALLKFRPELLRFAQLQLRDSHLAEDVVQEALAAALVHQDRFERRSQLKTWVFGILKHKIIDVLRDRARMPLAGDLFPELDDSSLDDLFDERGHWQEFATPADWGSPETLLASSQFWEILELCLERLPPRTARIFTMSEVLELEQEEICNEMEITPTNYWVILHRARMGLRLCLEQKWTRSPDSGRGI